VSSVTPNDWCAIAAASRADVARARRGPELGADLELGAGCTTSPPIAAAAKLAGVVRRDVSRVSG
jgi:hypothetical protein